jgi:DNA-binding transcriptional regulator YiaG
MLLTEYLLPCKLVGIMSKRRSITWDQRRIKDLRKHMGLTQSELAEELGTRQQTISEWEVGMYKPRGTSVTLLNIVADRSNFKYQPHAQEL